MNFARKSQLALAIVATLGLSACGGGSSDNTPTQPVNSAPTDISLSATVVDENAAGATVGTLSATDADAGDTFTFTTSDDRFEISGTSLKLKDGVAFDFEKTQSADVAITVTDSANATYSKTFTVTVNDLLDYYGFTNTSGESSVSYSGQTARHLLINDLTDLISKELGDVSTFDSSGTFTTREGVMNALNTYFEMPDYDAFASNTAIRTTTTPESKQTLYTEISSSSKNLVGKIAGNDEKGQHKDWSTEFAGWGAVGTTTPEGLVREFFNMLADNADSRLQGNDRQDPFGNTITNIYLTEDGRDLKQLIQKFLLMSVAFSQGADDYLDNDTDGKGLLSDHVDFGTKTYTALEHQFDEGFGYFGAARNFLDFSDEEIAKKGGRAEFQGVNDYDADGKIDFLAEYNFGQAVNASKRDLGATVATDFSKDAMEAFLKGRQLLSDTAGTALTDAQMTELLAQRDIALGAWEKAISATVVHYINYTIADLDAIGSDDFSYSDLAKHWSEMKGFALGLQFNRLSPMNDADFVQMHALMGDKPVLTGASEIAAYRAALLEARDLLKDAYGFNADNVSNW